MLDHRPRRPGGAPFLALVALLLLTAAACEITGPVGHPRPAIVSLGPDTASVGRATMSMVVRGRDFRESSVVHWEGEALYTIYVSESELRAEVDGSLLDQEGAYEVTVVTRGPGGGSSERKEFLVLPVGPTLTLLPSYGALAGGAGFPLIVHGKNFREGARVEWNGALRSTSYLGPTRLQVDVTAGEVATPGTARLRVVNPGVRPQPSNEVTLTVRARGAATATVTRFRIPGQDLIYDARRGLIYVAVPVPVGSPFQGVKAIDPVRLVVTDSLSLFGGPSRLAITPDGRRVYVGLAGEGGIREINADLFRPIAGAAAFGESTAPRFDLQRSVAETTYPAELEVVPSDPYTVLVAWHRVGNPPTSAIGLYGASGIPGSFRTGHDRIAVLGTAEELYGYAPATREFYTIRLAPRGLERAPATAGLISGSNTDIVGASGRIYATDGSVVDAGRHVRTGGFAIEPSVHAFVVDPETGRAFALTNSGLHVYDLYTYEHLAQVAIAGSGAANFPSASGASLRMVRWGDDGLAYLDRDELVLIRSPLVAR